MAVHAENDFYKLRDSISGKRLKKKKNAMKDIKARALIVP